MAEIVVADGVAGQPRVLWRKVLGPDDRVEKGEIHGLFRMADLRYLGNYPHPDQEKRQENALGKQQSAPFGTQKKQHRLPLPDG